MRLVVFLLFFISGACGLIYQVVWTRIMTHIFGTTVFAISIVLTAFMSGLAIGSYFLGKGADKCENPLRRYAYFEIGIGLTAVLTLFLMDRLNPLYLWLNNTFGYSFIFFTFIRFLVAFLILIIPTILMGATLPILSRFVIKEMKKVGRNLGTLYSINTFGAVCGSLLTGFYLIGHIGIHLSIYVAVLLNIVVGLVAWVISKKYLPKQENAPVGFSERSSPVHDASSANGKNSKYNILLLAFAISGFTSFAYEILWTRSLIFLVGNSTYAFVIMLTAFLTGIALGGYIIRFFIDRLSSPLRIFSIIEILIGFSAALAMPLLIGFIHSDLRGNFLSTVSEQWGLILILRFGISLLVMLVPTIMIGATFPLVGKIYIKDLKQTGADVGKIYAINTAGNILGAFIPAFLILPLLGINKGILLMAVLNITIGVVILMSHWNRLPRFRYIGPIALLCPVLFVVWMPFNFQFPSIGQSPQDKVLFYKEGISATTTVYLDQDTRHKKVSVDGICIGGTSPDVDQKQQILAHLPKLLLEDYNSELSVGLGSGILIGESAKHQRLKRIVCVEIAASVIQGAAHFRYEHNDVLNDPRVQIINNDGVNYLLTTSEKYDIISSDAKSRPEYGGNGVFFSKEYYSLLKEHLTPQGLVIQWIPIFYPKDDYRMIIKTMTSVFPNVTLWYFSSHNSFLVGSINKIEIDFARLKNLLNDPDQPFEGIRNYRINSAEALLSHYVASEDILKKMTPGIKENSFENPYIEFYSPHDYAVSVTKRRFQNLDFIRSIRTNNINWPWLTNINQEEKTKLMESVKAKGKYLDELLLNSLH